MQNTFKQLYFLALLFCRPRLEGAAIAARCQWRRGLSMLLFQMSVGSGMRYCFDCISQNLWEMDAVDILPKNTSKQLAGCYDKSP